MMRTGNSHAGRVNLPKYVKVRGDASETWRFCPVVRTGNGRIRPDYVLIEGRPELHKEGAYYIEWYRDGKPTNPRSVGTGVPSLLARSLSAAIWLSMVCAAACCSPETRA